MEPLSSALARLRPLARASAGSEPIEPEAPPTCSKCNDFGFVRRDVPVGHPDFGRAIPCDCRREEVRERLRRRSQIGALADRGFENFFPTGRVPLSAADQRNLGQSLEKCRTYAEDPPGWLLLCGPPGCGKTHLAAAIANRQIELGTEVFFTVVPDLLDHLRATFSPSSTVAYDDLFDEVRAAPLLILDDLGAHSSSPWAQEKLFQIVNYRYNHELPTVVTTNVPLDRLEPRLVSRMTDMGSALLAIAAPDFRGGISPRTAPLPARRGRG
jgi:DNA replication protein DnaC